MKTTFRFYHEKEIPFHMFVGLEKETPFHGEKESSFQA